MKMLRTGVTGIISVSRAICQLHRRTSRLYRPAAEQKLHTTLNGPDRNLFLSARRYASAGTSYGPVSVSATIRCSVETVERIKLVLP